MMHIRLVVVKHCASTCSVNVVFSWLIYERCSQGWQAPSNVPAIMVLNSQEYTPLLYTYSPRLLQGNMKRSLAFRCTQRRREMRALGVYISRGV